MALKETITRMHKCLGELCRDLDKAAKGNKAASQRVRTCSIKFGKISKCYRKESVCCEKGKKKTTKKKPVKKKAAPKKKVTKRKKVVAKKKKTTRRKRR